MTTRILVNVYYVTTMKNYTISPIWHHWNLIKPNNMIIWWLRQGLIFVLMQQLDICSWNMVTAITFLLWGIVTKLVYHHKYDTFAQIQSFLYIFNEFMIEKKINTRGQQFTRNLYKSIVSHLQNDLPAFYSLESSQTFSTHLMTWH